MPDRHSHRFRVRYLECDQQGVVFNAHYLAHFDLGLTELWRAALGSYQAMLDAGHDVVVVQATVRYLRPARFDDEVDVETRVVSFGTTSMRIANRLVHTADDARLAEGDLAYVFVDRSGAKVAVPEAIRRALDGGAAPAGLL